MVPRGVGGILRAVAADSLLHPPRVLRGTGRRAHARWFARPFPFARLAAAALGAVHPRSRWDLLVLDASFVPKSGRGTWGPGWFGNGMARAVRWSLEVALPARWTRMRGTATRIRPLPPAGRC